MAELELALVDAHLRSFSDHDDRVGSALADRPLTRGKTRDFITDDARSQCHHGGEAAVEVQHTASNEQQKKKNKARVLTNKTRREDGVKFCAVSPTCLDWCNLWRKVRAESFEKAANKDFELHVA